MAKATATIAMTRTRFMFVRWESVAMVGPCPHGVKQHALLGLAGVFGLV
jgi:hypothetical protein